MAQTQQVLRGSTATLIHYPARGYHPSAATINVISPALGDLEDYQTATRDSVDEVTTAAASEGARSLVFGSDPGCTVGRWYVLIDDVDGYEIAVRVLKHGSTTYLDAPLPRAMATGSRLRGLAITHDLTADETAELGHGVASIKYMIAGIDYRDDVPFEVVRSTSRYTLTGARLLAKNPAAAALRLHDDDLDDAVAAAWDDIVAPALLERRLDPQQILSVDTLEPCHTAATMHHLARNARSFDEATFWREEFDRQLAHALASTELWVSPETDDPSGQPQGQTDLRRWSGSKVIL